MRLRTKNDSLEEENEWLKGALTEIYDDKISRLNQQLFSSAVSTVCSEIFQAIGDVVSPAYIPQGRKDLL